MWWQEGERRKRIFSFSLRIFVVTFGVYLDAAGSAYVGGGECRDRVSSHIFMGGEITGEHEPSTAMLLSFYHAYAEVPLSVAVRTFGWWHAGELTGGVGGGFNIWVFKYTVDFEHVLVQPRIRGYV